MTDTPDAFPLRRKKRKVFKIPCQTPGCKRFREASIPPRITRGIIRCFECQQEIRRTYHRLNARGIKKTRDEIARELFNASANLQ